VGFSERDYEEAGFCRAMDFTVDDLCPLRYIFCSGQWHSNGQHLSIKGFEARGPIVTLPFSLLCGGAKLAAFEGGK